MDQRYVSSELTHFTGKQNPADEDQCFEALIKILKSGRLTPRPRLKTSDKFYAGHKRLAQRDGSWYVCFCDIPVADLAIHAAKYSRFGLSFSKSFIIRKGGSPVLYVPESRKKQVEQLKEKLEYFAPETPEFYEVGDTEDEDYQAALGLKRLVKAQFLALSKLFNPTLPSEDRRNYYLEREWRIMDDLKFGLKDVARVLLPKSYGKQLRISLPSYYGQVTFVHLKSFPSING